MIDRYLAKQSLRAARIRPLLETIEAVHAVKGRVSIIDVGGSGNYWKLVPPAFLDEHEVQITLVNLLPQGSQGTADTDRIEHVVGDGCNLSMYADGSFDIAHSNSVLEHVGNWDRMVQFSHELARVGVNYFVQTPNFWFPIEPHFLLPFFHWLPAPTRIWLVSNFTLGGRWKLSAKNMDEAVRLVESANLLSRKMFADLFKDGEIITERFYLLPKSFIAVRSPQTRTRKE